MFKSTSPVPLKARQIGLPDGASALFVPFYMAVLLSDIISPKALFPKGAVRLMDEKLSGRGLFHLCVVYVLWSTTYMAMRVGVGPSSGFPPFIFGALRFPLGALILLGLARAQGLNIKPTGRELISLCVVGNIFWLVGHGLILWASHYADSGFTCLMASSAPIWAAVLEVFIYKKRLSVPLIVSLLVGFSGIAVLSLSSLGRVEGIDLSVILALQLGAFGWPSAAHYRQGCPWASTRR